MLTQFLNANLKYQEVDTTLEETKDPKLPKSPKLIRVLDENVCTVDSGNIQVIIVFI